MYFIFVLLKKNHYIFFLDFFLLFFFYLRKLIKTKQFFHLMLKRHLLAECHLKSLRVHGDQNAYVTGDVTSQIMREEWEK